MVDWIIILGIHICREKASFQRREDGWSDGSVRRDEELRIYAGADECESIGRKRYNGSDSCELDGYPMKVINVTDVGRSIGPLLSQCSGEMWQLHPEHRSSPGRKPKPSRVFDSVQIVVFKIAPGDPAEPLIPASQLG